MTLPLKHRKTNLLFLSDAFCSTSVGGCFSKQQLHSCSFRISAQTFGRNIQAPASIKIETKQKQEWGGSFYTNSNSFGYRHLFERLLSLSSLLFVLFWRTNKTPEVKSGRPPISDRDLLCLKCYGELSLIGIINLATRQLNQGC